MRSLLVADNVPWPALGGGLVRLAQIVEAVASVSDLDLFVLHNQSQSKTRHTRDHPHRSRSKGVQNPHTSSGAPMAPGMGRPARTTQSRWSCHMPTCATVSTARVGPSAL